MATIRAKFFCTREATVRFAPNENQHREYEFAAVFDEEIPEGDRYATYKPIGSLKLTVNNAAVTFEPGGYYYLDITAAE